MPIIYLLNAFYPALVLFE